MRYVRWVIQNNLGKSEEIGRLFEACGDHAWRVDSVQVTPFSDVPPDTDTSMPTVFYGATRWIDRVYRNNIWKPGVFFNPESTVPFWQEKYGLFALNYAGEVTTLKELVTRDYALDRYFFIRPCSDQKEFPGCVLTFKKIKNWGNLIVSDSHELESIPILVAEPVGLSHEWRLFIVNGEVVSGSHYRSKGELDVTPDLPDEVVEFAKMRIAEYAPAPVFVMDIGESCDLYVIEIGCFNSAGFYASDIGKIVGAVSELVEGYR